MRISDTESETESTGAERTRWARECPARWEQNEPWIMKFVDDLTTGSKTLLQDGIAHITYGKEKRTIIAHDLADFYRTIESNSTTLGLKIHPEKTQLLCVSNAINYDVDSVINLPTTTIRSSETLKILGFVLNNKGNMSDQVKSIKGKFAASLWILRHLKRVGLSDGKLLAVYRCYILPQIEYGSVVYGSLLTQQQELALERLQSTALKTIRGWKTSYANCLAWAGMGTMTTRRADQTIKFARKTSQSQHFGESWFPRNVHTGHDLRRQERYHVPLARQDRLQKAPIYHMRRLLNGEAVGVDQVAGLEDLDD